MTQTIERQLHTPEQPANLHLDLNRVSQSEYSPENSRIILDITEPTADSPVKIYAASSKREIRDGDMATQSQLAVNENGEVTWRIDTDPQSVGFVYVRSIGEPEILGANERMTHGTFTIEPGAAVFMMPNQSIGEHLEHDILTTAGLEATIADSDLNAEAIKLSFEETITTENTPATGRLAKRLNAQAGKRRLDLKAERAQKKNNPLSIDAPLVTVERPTDVDNVAVEDHAVKNQPLEGYSRRTQARKKSTEASGIPEVSSDTAESTEVLDTTSPVDNMSDEERQYWEDERRGFKVTDNRKWSRIEMFGHEVGIHSDVSFTVPSKSVTPHEATSETQSVVESTASTTPVDTEATKTSTEVLVPATEVEPEKLYGSTVPFEVIDYNPNNDPSIEYGLSQLDALRTEMASLTANRQNRLFNFNSKKSREIAKAYNNQIVTLGQIVTADKLSDETLTDSQKNVAVAKFLVNEQAMLQAATKEKIAGTKEGKFIDWMSIHGRTADSTADMQKVMRAIEWDTSRDAKIEFAHLHMTKLYSERIRSEKKERLQGAARVVALGVVGMAAMTFGINPSMAGDAANNMLYGARKK